MMKHSKKKSVSDKFYLIGFCLLLFTFLSFQGGKIAEAKDPTAKFPSKPIKIIVPAGAAGSLGQEARMIAPFLEKNLGIAPVIEYITGAEGIIAYNKFYQEKADGYTIAYFSLASAVTLELTRESARYMVKNLSPIAAWNVKNQILGVHPDSWKTFADFLSDGKKRKISLGGIGGISILHAYLLESALGIKINFVPYDASAEAIAAVAGKHMDAVITYTTTPKPMIRAGKLRAIAVLCRKPDPIVPEVPNLKDLGHGDVPVLPAYGMFAAPRNTPREITAILEKAVRNSTVVQEFNKLADNIGIAIEFKSSGELSGLIAENYEMLNKYKQFIK
ncbi:MAG: tripartite tricarboxylate transporter substrate binding protein [Thermodesulfobacteriota bacterium]